MAEKNRVNVSTGPPAPRLSAKERQAARIAELANKQSELKREAAERRAKRAAESGADSVTPNQS
jgi:hypothetical protein